MRHAELIAMSLGYVAWVTIPGELQALRGLEIKHSAPRVVRQVFLEGLSNDFLGDVVSAQDETPAATRTVPACTGRTPEIDSPTLPFPRARGAPFPCEEQTLEAPALDTWTFVPTWRPICPTDHIGRRYGARSGSKSAVALRSGTAGSRSSRPWRSPDRSARPPSGVKWSYRHALAYFDNMEEALRFRVLERARGGHTRGGTRLTAEGRRFVRRYTSLRHRAHTALARLAAAAALVDNP